MQGTRNNFSIKVFNIKPKMNTKLNGRRSKAVKAEGWLVGYAHAWNLKESSGSVVESWLCISRRRVIAGNAGQVRVIWVCETTPASCHNLKTQHKEEGGKEKQKQLKTPTITTTSVEHWPLPLPYAILLFNRPIVAYKLNIG